jgi:hypothetical protein
MGQSAVAGLLLPAEATLTEVPRSGLALTGTGRRGSDGENAPAPGTAGPATSGAGPPPASSASSRSPRLIEKAENACRGTGDARGIAVIADFA